MSKFSDKCKEILKENGTNVYQLSAHASLERTSLQRMVTGKRLPQIAFLKTFCKALRLSKYEEEELLELYRIESMGEDAYRNEQSILKLLKHLRKLEDKDTFYDNQITSIQYQNMDLLSHVSSNSYDTELLIQYILKKEFSKDSEGFIYTNLPASQESFLHHLELFYRQFHKRLQVCHLMSFQINTSLTSENLDATPAILSLFLSNKLDYQVYYYYSRLHKHDMQYLCFPYYIVTSEHVLLISPDFQMSIILSEKELVEHYQKSFQKNLALSTPLFHKIHMLQGSMSVYNSHDIPDKSELYYFHYQPCYVDLFGEENLLNRIQQFLPQFYEIGKQFVQSILYKSNFPNFCYYSEEGLKDFCRTGVYYGQIGVFFPPMTIEERLEALKTLRKNNYHNNYIIKQNSDICFPKHLFIEMAGDTSLQILHIESLEIIDFITITESSICEAFYQFFKMLSSSKYIYTSEEAENLLDECIDELTVLASSKQ